MTSARGRHFETAASRRGASTPQWPTKTMRWLIKSLQFDTPPKACKWRASGNLCCILRLKTRKGRAEWARATTHSLDRNRSDDLHSRERQPRSVRRATKRHLARRHRQLDRTRRNGPPASRRTTTRATPTPSTSTTPTRSSPAFGSRPPAAYRPPYAIDSLAIDSGDSLTLEVFNLHLTQGQGLSVNGTLTLSQPGHAAAFRPMPPSAARENSCWVRV